MGNRRYALINSHSASGAPEGTAVLSTGEAGGTKFLREDGDGTCSWQAAAGGSEVNDLSSIVTWANVPDANITESSVTQHQAALSITESQISDLGSYATLDGAQTFTALNKFIGSTSSYLQIGHETAAVGFSGLDIYGKQGPNNWGVRLGIEDSALTFEGIGAKPTTQIRFDLGTVTYASGATVQMSDATNTDTFTMKQFIDRMAFGITAGDRYDFNTTIGLYITGGGGLSIYSGGDLWVRDAGELKISDTGDTDYATFSHDGTDFNIAATLTTDLNFTGFTDITVDGLIDGIDVNTDVTANTAKVTNATHTGDVTGATALIIAAGAVDIAMLSATGTPSGSTYLRGDNTWATVSGGGEVNDLTSIVTWANVPDANITQGSVTQHQAALSITESQISDLGSYLPLGGGTMTGALTLSAGTAAAAALGYADTGFYQISDNIMGFTSAGVQNFTLGGSVMYGTFAASPYLKWRTTASATVPSYAFNGDEDTGLGRNAANEPSIVAGGVESARFLATEVRLGTYFFDTDQVLGLSTDNYVLTYDDSDGQISLEAATGGSEVNDLTAAVTWANVPDANITQGSVTQHQAALTITGSQVSDFETVVAAGASTTANTAKVTNANHTGDVTGSTALTIAVDAVDIAMLSATGTPSGTTYLRGDNTWDTPAGGGGSDLAPYSTRDTTASQSVSSTSMTVNQNTETIADANYSLSADIITVTAAGVYLITWQTTATFNSNQVTTRDSMHCWIEKNSSTTGATHLNSTAYYRESSGEISVGGSGLILLAASDTIRLRTKLESGSDSWALIANKSWINMLKVS